MTAAAVDGGVAPDDNSPTVPWTRKLGFDRFSGLYLIAGFFIFFGLTESNYLTWNGSIEFVLTEKVIVCMLALAFLVPLVTGTFDLSIGANMALCLVIVNKMALETDLPDYVGAIVGMAACLLMGFINGFIVVKLRVNSFIATLGMSQVIAALIRKIYEGGQITKALGDSYINFGKKAIFSFRWPGTDSEISLPFYFLYGLIAATIIWYVLEHTPVGRHMFATGGNPEAARLSGVKVDRIAWGSLVASAGIAGFAATATQQFFLPNCYTDPFGNYLGQGAEVIAARDWARLGNLYLQDGVWNGERLLPKGYVKYVSTLAPGWLADGRPVYGGGFFWINGDGEQPMPRSAYAMLGAGGQSAWIIPSHDLVIVRIGKYRGADAGEAAREKGTATLLQAVRP